ncbi:Polymer-forming cytoskeletal family protein [Helicobacter sp. NHP19-012]|uniref:Polymer-forming cytoskeletal family protein n=1 Tax=Helicobacter gastrofelis TaxID=2849642 RepID=A0ABM7SL78_9HELI|nr:MULTISPECIES: polymer-forming cytoskeletal protein [unclassified Helicobacter]BCZ18387.1 Polymer-forming cytoskeletal family protein [Helicobacter sp. NHP19-012]GMB95671.1 Polymer-forming cytoskeletal family protein [Helicobacter sp. NHP22-001]
MAIFANDHKQPANGSATIIAQGTKFKGELNIDCHLHIDGEFEGTIHSKSVVVIGKNGVVMGEIFASKIVVSGKFNGNADADIIEIMSMGYVDGKIVSAELVIERKAVLTGESHPKDSLKKSMENKPPKNDSI